MPSLRAVISRARPTPDVPGLLVVEVTVEELDAMYTLVEQLTDAARSRRRHDLFTGIRADLCVAIDGFYPGTRRGCAPLTRRGQRRRACCSGRQAKLGMERADLIGKQLADARLWPAMDDQLCHHVQIGARVDPVRDAGADEGEDRGRALAAEVAVGEEPVLSSEDQRPQLALDPVVGQLDPTVGQEENEPVPRAQEIADGVAERRLGRVDLVLFVEPGAQLLERGCAVLAPTAQPLVGGLVEHGREALDSEEAAEDAQGHEGERVAAARAGDKAPPPMSPTPGALATRAFEEVDDAGAVALHRAAKVFAEEVLDALGIAVLRVEEGHPLLTAHPAPHRAIADAERVVLVEHRQPAGVGREQRPGLRLLADQDSDGLEQIDARRHAPPERLRRDVDAAPLEAAALALGGLVLHELVGDGFDDQRVAKLATLDDRRRCRGRHDRVVVRTGDALVLALDDVDARGLDLEDLARLVSDRRHLAPAQRADTLLRRYRVDYLHAWQVCGRRRAPRVLPLAALLRLRLLVLLARRRRSRRRVDHEREQVLSFEPLQRLGARTRPAKTRELLGQVEVDLPHAADEGHDRGDELDELERLDHLLDPRANIGAVRHERRGDHGLLGRGHLRPEMGCRGEMSSARGKENALDVRRPSQAPSAGGAARRRDRSLPGSAPGRQPRSWPPTAPHRPRASGGTGRAPGAWSTSRSRCDPSTRCAPDRIAGRRRHRDGR